MDKQSNINFNVQDLLYTPACHDCLKIKTKEKRKKYIINFENNKHTAQRICGSFSQS